MRVEEAPSAMMQIRHRTNSSKSLRPNQPTRTLRRTILPTDKDLFGAQAYLKGGIGNFVAQGLARRGCSSNPHGTRFSPSHTLKTLRQELQSYGKETGGNTESEILSTPEVAVFKTASRSTRCKDLDHASKWAAMSFFETDPSRVKHHMDILEGVEQMEMLDAAVAKETALQQRNAV